MNALASDAGALNSSLREVGSDPSQLVTLGDIYCKRICFSAPIWASLVALGAAWMAASVSCLVVIPVQPVFRKVGDGEVLLAAVILLGGMFLKNVTSRFPPSLHPPPSPDPTSGILLMIITEPP